MHMGETTLAITHPTGISFDLTIDEALGFADFINVYRQTLLIQQHDTNPLLERISRGDITDYPLERKEN
jgi:hypothetical protein